MPQQPTPECGHWEVPEQCQGSSARHQIFIGSRQQVRAVLPSMSSFGSPQQNGKLWTFKTRELLILVVISNVLGNVFLSHGMRENGTLLSVSVFDYLRPLGNPWVIIGVVILAIWMMADLALLSRADLSFVLPVTSVAYILIAILGETVLHEHISGTRWAGILLITLGVILVGFTPARTTEEHVMEDED